MALKNTHYDEIMREYYRKQTEDRHEQEERIRRATEEYKEDMGGNAEKTLQKKDKARATFYNVYSTYNWGDTRNYHLTLDSSIGIEKSAEVIKAYVEAREGK